MATKREVASHLDISEQWAGKMVKAGVIPSPKGRAGYDMDACRLAYIRYLRGVHSGQVRQISDTQPSDVPTEPAAGGDFSALLEQEKYRKVKRENDIEEGLVAPVSLLSTALEKAGSIIVATLESLPLLMKRHWPEITGDQIVLVKKAVAECRNAVADMKIDDEDE